MGVETAGRADAAEARPLDIESIMENLSQPQGSRAAHAKSATHPYKRLHDCKDCLATDNQGGHGVPSYATRTPGPRKPQGWTLAGRPRVSKRYLGRSLLLCRGKDSPGPIYEPRVAPTPQGPKRGDWPRQRRMGDIGRPTPGPGPAGPAQGGYEIPSTLMGCDKTRSASPACRFSRAERFPDRPGATQFISLAHSKSAPGGLGCPGPQKYFIDGRRPSSAGPSWSFGSQDAARGDRPRFNSKIFISRAHAAVSGGSSTRGPAPGQYPPDPGLGKLPADTFRAATSRTPRAPAWSIGGSVRRDAYGVPRGQSAPPERGERKDKICGALYISAEHSAKEVPRDDYPGPGHYFEGELLEGEAQQQQRRQKDAASRAIECVRAAAPSYSFGVHTDSSKRFYSSALAEGAARGRASPGPCYYPEGTAASRAAPCYSFADPDPDLAMEKGRFDVKRYIGAGIGSLAGGASPGPAEYDVIHVELPQGPAHSFARKERQLLRRIVPGPERVRFFSKELAKENFGCYSPGPKYDTTGALATSGTVRPTSVGTFGVSDRIWGESCAAEIHDKIGTSAKPYTNPGEARFFGKEYALSNLGRYSPGPKYHPSYSVSADAHSVEPSVLSGRSGDKDQSLVRREVLSGHRTSPAVSMGTRPRTKASADCRDQSPSHELTRRAAPSFGFGSAARSGVGACSQLLDAGKGDKDGVRKEVMRHIEITPGPGSFTPDFASVEIHVGSVRIGGLTDGSASPAPRRKARKEKDKKGASAGKGGAKGAK
eukprot:TRINITY_DN10272_c0_g1_i1.p1 TRINITY_DN10272_c0_g1~~TRINITY_DN10272_c0_g1_i1.p1  ORF type:complete len:808 (+),score=182.01 TRINITY_DN10272_c0_g1_i1:121-2424(+)